MVEGERARSLRREYDLVEGISIPGGVLGGKRGKFLVNLVTENRIEFSGLLNEPPLKRFPTIAIVAVPRPQTVKKVLSTASAMGVDQLHFVRAENTEKSYLDSHALYPDEVAAEVRLGLQQSGDTIAPKVSVHQRFRPFFEDTLKEILSQNPYQHDALKLFGHTPQSQSSPKTLSLELFGDRADRGVVCAIGPEAGWSNFESDLLAGLGFNPITLGPRTLRVETALAIFLGDIDMLRGLSAAP